MGPTTFWPRSQNPKIGHLRDDAFRDFSGTFGLLQFKPDVPLRPEAKWGQNGLTHPTSCSAPCGGEQDALRLVQD